MKPTNKCIECRTEDIQKMIVRVTPDSHRAKEIIQEERERVSKKNASADKWNKLNESLGKAMVAIDKRFENVITSLRTARATEYRLDKEATVNDDTLDSLRLNLSFYRRK